MRDAAMPGDHQHAVARENFAQNVRVGKNRAEHQRPGDDAALVHMEWREKMAGAKSGFGNEVAGDAVSDGVHILRLIPLRGSYRTEIKGEVLANTRPTRFAGISRACRVAKVFSAASGSTATSSPPEDCGSKSRARYSSETFAVKSTQSPMKLRLFVRPPGMNPSRTACKAPGKKLNWE